MPKGLSTEEKVLKQHESLYGLVQAPRTFFMHLKEQLFSAGMTQSILYPYLFHTQTVICVVNVDDYLFFSINQEDIDLLIEELKELKLDLHVEDDVADFLGNYKMMDQSL